MRFARFAALALLLTACSSEPVVFTTTLPDNTTTTTTTTPPTTTTTPVTTTTTVPTTTTTAAPTTTAFDPSKYVIHNVEDLSGATWSPPGLYLTVQDMTSFDGGDGWGGRHQFFVGADQLDSWVEFIFPIIVDGVYEVEVWLTKAPDFGIVRVTMDGMDVDDVDLYDPDVRPTRGISLGEFEFGAGGHTMRFTVIGKSPSSTGFRFGIDTITVIGPH